jgi:hypothetical protein
VEIGEKNRDDFRRKKADLNTSFGIRKRGRTLETI